MTIGLGAQLLHARRDRPVALRDLPAFAGDDLDPDRCGGAACVLICSRRADRRPQPLRHAALDHAAASDTPNGALGFRDGTMNPRRPLDLDQHVWVSDRDRT